jgi:membrane fusion protein (multidrug efflux system)
MPASPDVEANLPHVVSRSLALPAPALALMLAACGPAPAPPAPAAPPPVEVGVVTAAPSSVALVAELPGRTEASRIAQVRARVPGIVQRQLFREGSEVEAGQPLFRIDDAPYRATLASAQAGLARAEANRVPALAQAERYEPLVRPTPSASRSTWLRWPRSS